MQCFAVRLHVHVGVGKIPPVRLESGEYIMHSRPMKAGLVFKVSDGLVNFLVY